MKALILAAVAALAVGSVASQSFASAHDGAAKTKKGAKKSSKKEEAAPAAQPAVETAPAAAPADAHAAPAGH